jgi:hypothetical protein
MSFICDITTILKLLMNIIEIIVNYYNLYDDLPTNIVDCLLCLSSAHRYLKKSRLFKLCYVPATNAAFSKGIFVAATNSTNQTNKAGSTCH